MVRENKYREKTRLERTEKRREWRRERGRDVSQPQSKTNTVEER